MNGISCFLIHTLKMGISKFIAVDVKYCIYLFLFFGYTISKAQLLADFETTSVSPALSGEQASITTNPDVIGNSSSKVAYYRKASGNWKAIYFNFASVKNTGVADQLTFKLRSSLQGRVFVKVVKGATTVLEDWAPEYAFRPEAGKWTVCTLNIASIKNKDFDRIEVNAAVDNESVADVYLDDFKLVNSKSPNGEPIIEVAVSPDQVVASDVVHFDASSSVDSDGTISSYQWDFGDSQTGSGAVADHAFVSDGIYIVSLIVTDNEGKRAYWKRNINVFPASGKLGKLAFTHSQINTYEKAEALFLVKGSYANVYDPDLLKVDAVITRPDASTLTVPCFYYEKAVYTPTGDKWTKSEGNGYWMLRFSSSKVGMHQVQLRLTDAEGTVTSGSYSLKVDAGAKPGFIKVDPNNKQYYRYTTGEPFYPLGINVAWNSTTNYATTITNLGKSGANLVRYWQVPFDKQGLEWKNGSGFYKGLGVYSQEAAAEQDSVFSLCEKTNTYLQVTLFQHGMFSETVDSNWADNPYNSVDGGPLTKAEQYFYDATAKARTKKLLRYIVARWGYSRNLFAWELFNEVNFTGGYPNQTAQWYPGVKAWHDEMGQYIKSLDAFAHPVTTSSDESHLPDMDKLTGLDIVQYHLYTPSLLPTQVTKDKNLLAKVTRTGVINGEYGLDVTTADVPFDVQRNSIWTGIMTQVPHIMWKWENYMNTTWSDLFTIPSQYLRGEDFVSQGALTDWTFNVEYGTAKLSSVGFYSSANFYALIYDNDNRTNLNKVVVDLSKLPAGHYTLYFHDVLTGAVTQREEDIYSGHNQIELPAFSKSIAIKAKYTSPLPDTVTGVEPELIENEIVPYPNPAGSMVQFRVPKGGNTRVVVLLYNVTGKELNPDYDVNHTDGLVTVNLANSADGVYLMKIRAGERSYFKRIVHISK